MAYCNYGAFVYLNGKRMKEFEDCNYCGHLTHGLIQDGDIDVVCYKQGLPNIYYKGEKIIYYDENEIDFYFFEPFHYEFKGYKFYFNNKDKPYVVEMKTPNGDLWRCEYDYLYGAGF